jgi:tetratricopeptide (TPR) repeat protein
MAIKSEKELNEQSRSYWLKAVAAIELHNLGYAIELLQHLLKQEPEFLTARRMLRRAEVTRLNSQKKGFFNLSSSPLAIMKAQREVKKSPQRAIELVENVLETNPYNSQANMILKEAALAAGYPEVAMFAMETLLEAQPNDTKILHQLAKLYSENDRAAEAVEIYNRITAVDPTDLQAIKLGKDASARASMQKGGWNQAQSYRDVIKDEEIAVATEQQNRIHLDTESLERQIETALSQHQADPQNLDLARRLAFLHDKKGDLESAISWYESAIALTNKGDPSLVRKVFDLKLRRLDQQITEEEACLAAQTVQDDGFAARAARLVAAKEQRTSLLIEELRKRLARNPADLQLHYELGEQLTRAGKYREALPELQRARQNPNTRLKAMNLLGLCYRRLGMADLAARQLKAAADEMSVMDAFKKEVLYNLGRAYEDLGETERYLDAMKTLYEADYGYRDVAQRVERSYRSPEGD